VKFFTLIKCLLLSVVFVTNSWAQVKQVNRIELVTTADTDYGLTTLKNKSIVIYALNKSKAQINVTLYAYDSAQTKTWEGNIAVDSRYSFSKQYTLNNSVHFLFNIDQYIFAILQVNLEKQTYSFYELQTYIPIQLETFKANTTGCLLAGYFNNVPIVLYFEFATERVKILPGLFSEQGELNQIEVYENGNFDVIICSRFFTKQKTIWVKSYNANGDLITQLIVLESDQRSLQFGRTIQLNESENLVVGVYGNRYSEYSKGIFIAKIKDYTVVEINYYSYTDLENFFKFMKAKKEARVKTRIERRKIKGRKNYKNYRLLVHELIRSNNQTVLVAEGFYPKYKNSDFSLYNSSYYMGQTRNIPNNALVFDGYRYTHAVILGINKNGRLIWDNAFEINDVKTFKQEQFVRAIPNDDKINLIYCFEDNLKLKTIRSNKVIENKTALPLEVFSAEKKIISTKSPTLTYWKNNTILVYGIQEILTHATGAVHTVFFVNTLESQ
jgi:hypothetical protein